MGIQPSGSIDEEDLVGYGIIGLIEAVERFEPERGFRFETFATTRIRGSILDALRSLDPLPRSARQRVATLRDAIDNLRQRFGRMPSDSEIVSYTGMDLPTYEQALTEAGFAIVSLDAPLAPSEDGQANVLGDIVSDPADVGLLHNIEEQELRQELKEALLQLPQREQQILALYYYEDLTMREIADVLDLSQARVCQLHAKTILLLRAVMRTVGMSSSVSRGRRGARTVELTA
jgi:RNA polymerase sigma factor for flagellar operon FliA